MVDPVTKSKGVSSMKSEARTAITHFGRTPIGGGAGGGVKGGGAGGGLV
jgi:hypothetical protein